MAAADTPVEPSAESLSSIDVFHDLSRPERDVIARFCHDIIAFAPPWSISIAR